MKRRRTNDAFPSVAAPHRNRAAHLQKQETVSSMSSGSTAGSGLGAGDGGTLRYLTCSTRRAARAPLRRRMLTGQRRPGLSSSPAAPPGSLPPPPSLILRIQAFTTMHLAAPLAADTSTTEAATRRAPAAGCRRQDAGGCRGAKNAAHVCAPRSTETAAGSERGERTCRGPRGDITPYQRT